MGQYEYYGVVYGRFMGQYDGISHEKTTNPIDMIFFLFYGLFNMMGYLAN